MNRRFSKSQATAIEIFRSPNRNSLRIVRLRPTLLLRRGEITS